MFVDSYSFIFLFFPALVVTVTWMRCHTPQHIPLCMLLASCIFYASWNISFLLFVLCMSICNYAFGLLFSFPFQIYERVPYAQRIRDALLYFALAMNVLPLLFVLYPNLGLHDWAQALSGEFLDTGLQPAPGIAYFTLIQWAWLMAVYRKEVTLGSLLSHTAFSSCFLYTSSGPLVRYAHMEAQFSSTAQTAQGAIYRDIGLTRFVLGFGKTALLAASLAPYADAVFTPAAHGFVLSAMEAWLGVFAYAMQIYFIFSGYTDMTLGIALLLGLRLPENFVSPYKATGMVEFWRRWHTTLSSWLRDMLYIPLGGQRAHAYGRYGSLFLTMVMGGLWHGGGWTFLCWGAVHGALLCANHALRVWVHPRVPAWVLQCLPVRILSIGSTFLLLSLAWVLFRADTLSTAAHIYVAMLSGFHDGQIFGTDLYTMLLPLLCVCAALVWFFPNSQEFLGGSTEKRPWLRWQASSSWAIVMAGIAFASLLVRW